MINLAIILKRKYTALEHYRQVTPHEYMRELDKDFSVQYYETDGGVIDQIPDDELKKFQVIQFIRQIDPRGEEHTKKAIDRLHSLGIKVVFDIDDHWLLDKDHSMYAHSVKTNYTQTATSGIKYSDWVTTTTAHFADEIKPYNSNITVLPNCISPLDKQWTISPIENARIRFGWVGGVFHLPDVELLRPAIQRINKSFNGVSQDEYQLCLAGFNPSAEYINMERVLTCGHSSIKRMDSEYYSYLVEMTPAMEHISYDKPYRRIWTKSVQTYGQVYNEIDVALVPLRDTLFNNCKSELKIIEAGTMGKAVIASCVTPYQQHIADGNNGMLATNWYDEIKYMIREPEHRKDMAAQLSEDIKKTFNSERIQTERAQLYKRLVQ